MAEGAPEVSAQDPEVPVRAVGIPVSVPEVPAHDQDPLSRYTQKVLIPAGSYSQLTVIPA